MSWFGSLHLLVGSCCSLPIILSGLIILFVPSLRFVWHARIPTKIPFLAWRLLNALLPFVDVLVSLGFYYPSKCPFCSSADTLVHGFVDCFVAREL